MDYYQNNLLIRHKRIMWAGIITLLLLALAVTWSIIWSFGRYRLATQSTYVFHQKGAAIGIYDERSHPAITKLNPSRPNR